MLSNAERAQNPYTFTPFSVSNFFFFRKPQNIGKYFLILIYFPRNFTGKISLPHPH